MREGMRGDEGSGNYPEVSRVIRKAKRHEIDLSPSQFVWYPSVGWTLDGMDANEWLESMVMD